MDFLKFKQERLYRYAINKAEEHDKECGVVSLPEWLKPYNERISTIAGEWVDKLTKEGRINEAFMNYIL